MTDNVYCKFAVWCVFLVVTLTFGLRLFYFGTFSLINRIDSTIFFRYASENMYTDDIYFSSEAEEETGFFSDLNGKIDGFEEVVNKCISSSDNYELRLFLEEHIDEVSAIANENNKYIDYLEKKGSSLEHLSEYVHNMAKLNDYILQVAMYFSFLLICIVSLSGFKYRKGFYIASVVIYMIVMASVFSDGLTDYVVSNVIALIARINKQTFTYFDMDILKKYVTVQNHL